MFLKQGEKTIVEMETALQNDYDTYMSEKETLSDVMQELREKQLMEQQQIIELKKQSLQQDLEILNDRLYKPIEDNPVSEDLQLQKQSKKHCPMKPLFILEIPLTYLTVTNPKNRSFLIQYGLRNF
ncbi:MAG: hypothetical protein IPM77_00380 [Crocinitomicaceae bacterium]|nr:hypothetical protein [Crocinitomicaceae bacterium]